MLGFFLHAKLNIHTLNSNFLNIHAEQKLLCMSFASNEY